MSEVDEALAEVTEVLESVTPASEQLARKAARAVLAHLAATGRLTDRDYRADWEVAAREALLWRERAEAAEAMLGGAEVSE